MLSDMEVDKVADKVAYMVADMFTKGLSSQRFVKLRCLIGMVELS